jgi:hypothetical protein
LIVERSVAAAFPVTGNFEPAAGAVAARPAECRTRTTLRLRFAAAERLALRRAVVA